MADRIIVDTCIWVPFFNKPQSRTKQIVDQLVDENKVQLIGPIVSEILQGFRRDEHARWVASELRGIDLIELTWPDWIEAANLSRDLAKRGHRLPLSDLFIAATALRTGCALYSTDPHFDLIPALKRFTPGL